MGKKLAFALTSILILAAVAILAWRRPKESTQIPEVRVVTAVVGTSEETVLAPGTVVPSHTTNVSILPGFSGVVKRVEVEVGSKVKKGQILAELDPQEQLPVLEELRARAKRAEADLQLVLKPYRPEQIDEKRLLVAEDEQAVEEAKARLDLRVAGNRPQEIAQARDALSQERALLKVVETENARTRSLYAKDLVSLADVQKSDADLSVQRDKVSAAKEQFDLLQEGFRTEDIRAARAALAKERQVLEKDRSALKVMLLGSRPEAIEAARQSLRSAESAVRAQELLMRHQFITSPIDGIISERNVNLGEVVSAPPSSPRGESVSPLANNSEALFQIVDPHNLQFMASVDQFLFGTVLEGQTAEVTIESLPGRSFHARISRVQSLVSSEEKSAPGKANPSSPLTFLAWAKIDDPAGILVPGQTGLISAKKPSRGLVIPQAAVSSYTIGEGTVLVVEGQKLRTKVIRYEGNSAATVRILSGLEEGEKVVVSDRSKLSEGIEVRAIEATPDDYSSKAKLL